MPLQEHTDSVIISRHFNGDPLALGELDRRYRGRLLRYCSRLLDSETQAEDIVQTAFTKAFLSLERLEAPGAFYGWLFTIARNEVFGVIRTKGNAIVGPIDDEVSDPETPLEILDRSRTAESVNRAIDELRLPYREIIILRHFEGMSYAQIATLTGESISAIESRLHKARRTLAQQLKPLWDEQRIA
jgi:RNA polymerase sigma-70 factor, ECF subfamily